MRKILLILITILFIPSLQVIAEDIIQIVPTTTFAGATEDDEQCMEVQMVNDTYDEVGIVSFDLLLPEGITFLYEDFEGDRVPFTKKGSNISYDFSLFDPTLQASGYTRYLLVPGGKLRPITGKSGTFMYLYFEVDVNMEPGVYPIMIQETVIGKSETEGIYPGPSVSYIVVKASEDAENPTQAKGSLDLSTMTGYVPSFVVEKVNKDLADNENLTIVDLSGATELGSELVTPDNVVSVVGTTGTLKREFTATYWSTVCLPFPLNATQVAALNEEGVEIEEFTGFDETAGTVTFEPVTTMEANTPYIVKSETTQSPFTNLANVQLSTAEMNNVVVGKMTFMGTFEKQTLNSSTNTIYYAYNASNGEFVRIGSNATVPPFRAYLKLELDKSIGARSFIVNHGDGEATGIDHRQQECNETAGVRYNLLGMPQAENSKVKGIFIQNGQKIVVR